MYWYLEITYKKHQYYRKASIFDDIKSELFY